MNSAAADYEQFVAGVVESFVGNEVQRSPVFRGKITGRQIQMDASFNVFVAGGANLLIVVECKHYKHRVQVDDVEEFHSKLDDIGAHKGILVTTVGFQDGAKKAAQGRGIALALLTKDAQPGEIQYIMASGSRHLPIPRRSNDNLFQGNIVGVLSTSDRGIRFESASTVVGLLLTEAMATKRP